MSVMQMHTRTGFKRWLEEGGGIEPLDKTNDLVANLGTERAVAASPLNREPRQGLGLSNCE